MLLLLFANQPIHKPLPEDHPFYALVGRVTSEWAHLEHALDLLIWKLAEIDNPFGACITAQIMGATPRFNTLVALATKKNLGSEITEAITELMRKTYDVQEDRNRLVHDPWYIETKSGQPGQFKSVPRRGLQYGYEDVSEEFMLETIARIRRRRQAVTDLTDKIFSPRKPSR